MTYFSEREIGELPRTETEIAVNAWRGITAVIEARIYHGAFGAQFPEICDDSAVPCGTDDRLLWQAMAADIPELPSEWTDVPPPALQVMDLVEFCWRAVGKPIKREYHSFFRHYHLDFDVPAGRAEFREAVNRIFRRNGLAYDLTPGGEIQRLAPPGLREALVRCMFTTGDNSLNAMLEAARLKFLDPDEAVRREALEKLWDAFERIKTIEPGADKKAQATALLDRAAGSGTSKFRTMLEAEARELTNIGNTFHIRHTEIKQEPLAGSDQVDYLFHRLFAFIRLILRATGRGG